MAVHSRALLLALGGIALAVIGLAALGMAMNGTSREMPRSIAPETPADLTAEQLMGFSKLDADSQALALEITASEFARATIVANNDERVAVVADRATALGLEPILSGEVPPSVQVLAPRATILEVAAIAAAARVHLEEDVRANRAVAEPLDSSRLIPTPGTPYLDSGIRIDGSRIAIPAERLGSMLGSMANAITTIDGQPYPRASVEGGCDDGPATSCYLTLTGLPDGSAGRADVWPMRASVTTGWVGLIDPGQPPDLAGVPRWLVREAERIARSDPPTAAVISGMATFEGARWNPATPGTLRLVYASDCGGLGRIQAVIGRRLAGTGDCAGGVTIVIVDVSAGRVLNSTSG